MIIQEITEYEHFVSFVVKDENGKRYHVQYRSDQLEKNERGKWYFKTEPEPIHINRLPPLRRVAGDLSSELLDAIEKAIKDAYPRGCRE